MISYKEATEVFEYNCDTGDIFWRISPNKKIGAGRLAGCVNGCGYRQIAYKGKLYLTHRLAWLLHYGEWPKSTLDHINRDKLDNRIINMREASHRTNMRNRSAARKNISGIPGVHWDKRLNKWVARINIGAGTIYLGLSKNLFEAACLRLRAEHKYSFRGGAL